MAALQSGSMETALSLSASALAVVIVTAINAEQRIDLISFLPSKSPAAPQ
jgi:hypothetical protein